MSKIALIFMLAVTVEALIEYGKTIAKAFVGSGWKTAVTQLTAIAVSVLLCFAFRADLYATLGVSFTYGWIGIVLTGVFASRGSNYMSDFIKMLQGTKAANISNIVSNLTKTLQGDTATITSDLLPADVLADQAGEVTDTTKPAEIPEVKSKDDQATAAAVPVPDCTTAQ